MVQQISLRLIKTITHEFDSDFGILSDGFITKRQAASEHLAIGKCFIYSLFQLNLSHLHLKLAKILILCRFSNRKNYGFSEYFRYSVQEPLKEVKIHQTELFFFSSPPLITLVLSSNTLQ